MGLLWTLMVWVVMVLELHMVLQLVWVEMLLVLHMVLQLLVLLHMMLELLGLLRMMLGLLLLRVMRLHRWGVAGVVAELVVELHG